MRFAVPNLKTALRTPVKRSGGETGTWAVSHPADTTALTLARLGKVAFEFARGCGADAHDSHAAGGLSSV
ncbi:hypothetical protein AAFF_G00065300 [Aldrovandia affinis]|uniref:Uncharacterized protein n=1 Tax=Aldrovandia affinis TaxID=143900 RepID=A0AAD7T553_9TELE|nr:hypothetical protein AAFF_G00065300 [Aldrovandia affinis]